MPARRTFESSVGLLLIGATVGAVLAVGVLAVWGLAADGPGGFPYVLDAFEIAGLLGAALGAVMLPLISLTLLPGVSSGRIVIETALGSVLGAVVAIVAGADPLEVPLAAAAGFGIATLRLRRRQARP